MSSALVLAEQKVPRYTSYPTAPHFTAAISPDTYAQWLAALTEAATLSLYIHVPYCTELCLYCGCHTKMVRRPEPLQAYARRLAGEIALVARTLALQSRAHPLGRRHAVDPRSRRPHRALREHRRALRSDADSRVRDRAGPAADRSGARASAGADRVQPRQPRHPGLRAASAGGERPGAAVRDSDARGAGEATGRYGRAGFGRGGEASRAE